MATHRKGWGLKNRLNKLNKLICINYQSINGYNNLFFITAYFGQNFCVLIR